MMNQTKQTSRFALFFFILFLFSADIVNLFPFVRNLPRAWYSVTVQTFYFVVPTIIYFLWTKNDIQTTLRLRPLGMKNFIIVAAFGTAIQPMMQFLSYFTSLFFPNVASESLSLLSQSNYFVVLLSMAVLPAVFEEMALRGVFLSGFSKLGIWRSCFCTALLFGLLHMNPQQFPYAFAAGFFFCYLAQRTGSIWASIVPHFIINATSVTGYFFSPESTTTSDVVLSTGSILLYLGTFVLLSLPVLALLLYALHKVNPINPDIVIPKEETEKFLSPSIFAIFIIFLVFGVLPYFI